MCNCAYSFIFDLRLRLDAASTNLAEAQETAVSFLTHVENVNGRVLIHCLAGKPLYTVLLFLNLFAWCACSTNSIFFYLWCERINHQFYLSCTGRRVPLCYAAADAPHRAPPHPSTERLSLRALMQVPCCVYGLLCQIFTKHVVLPCECDCDCCDHNCAGHRSTRTTLSRCSWRAWRCRSCATPQLPRTQRGSGTSTSGTGKHIPVLYHRMPVRLIHSFMCRVV